MNQKATLYYEVHITIDPCFDKLSAILDVAHDLLFKMADLLMVKNDHTEQEHVKDMFFTTRTTDYYVATQRVIKFIHSMNKLGVPVRRYKIEDTVLDSRRDDVLGLL